MADKKPENETTAETTEIDDVTGQRFKNEWRELQRQAADIERRRSQLAGAVGAEPDEELETVGILVMVRHIRELQRAGHMFEIPPEIQAILDEHPDEES